MRRQGGVALIMVLLVVALVTVVCAGLMLRQQLAIRSTGNQLLVRQAQYYAEGGERLAMALLRRDLRQGDPNQPLDFLGEAWARPRLSFPLDGGGELHLHIDDLAGRFNLNNLKGGGEDGLALQRFQRLLLALGIVQPYAERLQDWLDSDQDPVSGNGAEDDQYLLLAPAYRTGPGLVADVSELRLLLGMSDADFRRLQPFVSALPAEIGLNVNTASAQVLASLAPGVEPRSLDALLAMQRREGFRDFDGFKQLFAADVAAQGLVFASQYFQVTTEVLLGDRRQVLVSYLQRGKDGRVRVLARDLGQDGLVPLPAKESEE